MSIANDHKLRHKILIALNSKMDGQTFKARDTKDIMIPITELLTLAGIKDEDYRRVISSMYDEEEIEIKEYNKTEHIYIRQKGMTALNVRKYLQAAQSHINESIYNVVKWVVPIVLAAIALYTTIRTITENKHIRERLYKIESQLNTNR